MYNGIKLLVLNISITITLVDIILFPSLHVINVENMC